MVTSVSGAPTVTATAGYDPSTIAAERSQIALWHKSTAKVSVRTCLGARTAVWSGRNVPQEVWAILARL
jgi:hypothetical protein